MLLRAADRGRRPLRAPPPAAPLSFGNLADGWRLDRVGREYGSKAAADIEGLRRPTHLAPIGFAALSFRGNSRGHRPLNQVGRGSVGAKAVAKSGSLIRHPLGGPTL